MKKMLVLLLFVALAGAGYFYFGKSTAPEFALEEGYRYLYDGKSLDGWRVIGGESTFKAEGESIVGRAGPGKNTFLRTANSFGDFSLKMQVRWDELGNSGVQFRSQEQRANERALGYQYELDPSERAWTGGIYDEARRGWLADLANNPAARAALRPNDWNDIEIEARGVSLKTWINDVPAADIIDGMDASGFIALQVHSGGKGIIRWRRIRIRELPPMVTAGASLLGAVEWRGDAASTLEFGERSISGPALAEDAWLVPRRQFRDALVRMEVPACEEPTTIQMAYAEKSAKGGGPVFAEIKVYTGRAEARVLTPAGEQVFDAVSLKKSGSYKFTGIVRGQSMLLGVGMHDVLRLDNVGLPERGQLRIRPANCGQDFRIGDPEWFALKEPLAEPLLYQTLDNEPSLPLSPEAALEAFKLAPGFEIELVAAEPLVEDPVAISWDEYGRLYVVEMRGYMLDAYAEGADTPIGQVVRLEDTDGDGRMDTSQVFLGGLVNPRAVAVVNEGVLIGEPPNLWLCPLADKKALCTQKQRVGGYAEDMSGANVEHMENGLRQGLDNWLYNSRSTRQLRLRKGQLEQREGLYRGQWGISHDHYGRWLYNHNSTWLQADFFAAEDLVEPGETVPPPGLGVNLTAPAEVYSVRVNPGVNRAYLDNTLRPDGRLQFATGASGVVAYRGDQFPREYRTDAFVPEAAGNVVAQFALKEEGMALTATQRLYPDERWGQRDFLGSTDERFRPVDAMNGPDGALYIIDMYRGIVQDDHYLTDELREQIFQRGLDRPLGMGRIWRVRHSEGNASREIPQLRSANDFTLVTALAHSNGWVRETAQRLLLDRPGDLRKPLGLLVTGDSTLGAIHAIWTLQGRAELQRELVLTALASGDLQRQIQALRAGHALLDSADLIELQAAQAEAPEALQMQLALALGNHAGEPGVRAALGRLLQGSADSEYVRQAVLRAVRGVELAFLQENLTAEHWPTRSAATMKVFVEMGDSAYRSLRGDLSVGEPGEPSLLLELLALVQSRTEAAKWQQVALLRGMARVARTDGFVPVELEAAPALFTDASVGEEDPLWKARLAGRVAFTWPGDEVALGLQPLSPDQLQLLAQGEAFYPQCGTCHGAKGGGTSGLAPPLADSEWVTGPPEWLARIILQGMTGPVQVQGKTFEGVMPSHSHVAELDDATLAGLMTYMRRNWGNKADAVSVETVAAIRAASAGRTQPWTAAELEQVPFDRGYGRFAGKYSISFVTFTISEERGGLHVSVPMYGSGIATPLAANRFAAAAGGENVELEFPIQPDGTVTEMLLHREGEKIRLPRSD